MSGRLFYIMGPSGAGKDSVLAAARSELDRRDMHVARRVITRPVSPGDEEHEAVELWEFERRQAAGHFALVWQAHGLHYGIPISIDVRLQRGQDVLINGSRAAIDLAWRAYPTIQPIVITAPETTIDARLSRRGREDAAGVHERLTRNDRLRTLEQEHPTVLNDGDLANAATALLQLLDQA